MKRTVLLALLALFPLLASAAGTATVRVTNAGSVPIVVEGRTIRPSASATVSVAAGEAGAIAVSAPDGWGFATPAAFPSLRTGATYSLRLSPVRGTAPAPVAPAPEPVAPAPVVFAPEPVAPVPSPVAPAPAPVAPAPVPVAPAPAPVAPAPVAPAPVASAVPASAPEGMVLVPAGVNEGVDPDFGPYRMETVGFYMDRTEITYSQWKRVFNWALDHDYRFAHPGAGRGGEHPVQTIDWYDCAKWCNARSEMEGLTPVYFIGQDVFRTGEGASDYGLVVEFRPEASGYRLPSRLQWEYAARGGKRSSRFPWGDRIDWNHANYRAMTRGELAATVLSPSDSNVLGVSPDVPLTEPPVNYDTQILDSWRAGEDEGVRNCMKRMAGGADTLYDDDPLPSVCFSPSVYAPTGPLTASAASFEPNGYGLFDMAGNVSEWLQSPDFGGVSPEKSACFGGSWCKTGMECRFGQVAVLSKDAAGNGLGFRTVLPAGRILGEENGDVSAMPIPPVFHPLAARRRNSSDIVTSRPFAFSWVPCFTPEGWERRQPDPAVVASREWTVAGALKGVVDAYSSEPDPPHGFGPVASATPVDPVPLAVAPSSVVPSPAAPVSVADSASSTMKSTSVSNGPKRKKSLVGFRVRRVDPSIADLLVIAENGKATMVPNSSFSFGRMQFSLLNRTKHRIVLCKIDIEFPGGGAGGELLFSDIPPGEKKTADNTVMLLGSSTMDNVFSEPFLFPSLILVDRDGTTVDLYEEPDLPSVGCLPLKD